MGNFCFMIGNRKIETVSDWIYPDIVKAIEKYVTEYGVTEFLIGNVDYFDRLAQEAAVEVKRRHPEMKLTMLLHYKGRLVDKLPDGFDGTIYPEELCEAEEWFRVADIDIWMLFKARYIIIYSPLYRGEEWSYLNLARAFDEKGWIKLEHIM